MFFICIRIADFSWGMNDKRIIEFGFRRISELLRPRSALSDLGLNNSEYSAQPHLIIRKYRVSKKKLMPFQIQISREFHYGTLSIPIGTQRTDRD